MEPEATNRYAEYFQSIRQLHAQMPPDELQALLNRQLDAIRAHLVADNHAPEVIEAEMRQAIQAAGPMAASPARKSIALKEKLNAWLAPLGGAFAKYPAAILICLFALAYVSTLVLFLREGHPVLTVKGVGAEATPVEVHFIAVDLARETITMTITPDLKSPIVAARGRMTSDVQVEIDTGTTVLTHLFKNGEVPVPWHATIAIDEGDVLEYPFDKHTGDFHIKATRRGANNSLVNLELDKVAHGFSLKATGEPTPDNTQLNVLYEIRRSPAVLFLAFIAMLSLTLVVASAINVAWQVARNGRKVEFSMMVWIAALLFVVPTVRNGLPGGPPPGAFVDIALFFWLHVLTVGALLTVVWNWSRQK